MFHTTLLNFGLTGATGEITHGHAPGELLLSTRAPDQKPYDKRDYPNQQKHSHPDTGFENVSDDFTPS